MKNKEFNKKFAQAKSEQISKEILDRQKRVNTLIFDATQGKIKNVREIKIIKREIAKLHTFAARDTNEN